MKQVLVNESSLQDIANAIREKTEGTEPILPSEMGNVIRAMETGGAMKSASGTVTNSTGNLTVTGLGFKPKAVYVFNTKGSFEASVQGVYITESGGYSCGMSYKALSSYSLNSDGFQYTTGSNVGFSCKYQWFAHA